MSDWKEPKPLIECINNRLELNNATARLIEEIDKPMVVATIAGLYRTGKSYLMNRLAGKSTGFSLGATVQSHTKGIWAWRVRHPLDNNKVLLLMDTEGLGDPMKGDLEYDNWICCLSVLLSSVFIYNVMGNIGRNMIDTLSFTVEMSRHLRARSSTTSDVQLDEHFPTFVLAIRDFFLSLETDRPITADEYLEEMLTMRRATSAKGIEQNEIRKKIRSYFKRRRCFCFTRPTSEDADLQTLDTLPENKLKNAFLNTSQKFCNYIFEHGPVKSVDYSQAVKGRTFIQFANIYLNAIHDGAIPCIETAIVSIKRRENENAINESIRLYEENVRCLTEFPVHADQLATVHEDCHRSAVALFNQKVFLDEGNEYHARLQETLIERYENFVRENNEASYEKCTETLQDMFALLIHEVEKGSYTKPGGYETYTQDVEDIELRYQSLTFCDAFGPMADYAWLRTVKEHEMERIAILQADQNMTDLERQAKSDEAKCIEAQKLLQLERAKAEEAKLHEQTIMKAHEEHVENLSQLYEERHREQQEKFETTMKEREKEQRRLMEERFEEDAQSYRRQLDEVKSEQTSTVSRIFNPILGLATNVLTMIPNPYTKAVGIGLGIVSSVMGFFRR